MDMQRRIAHIGICLYKIAVDKGDSHNNKASTDDRPDQPRSDTITYPRGAFWEFMSKMRRHIVSAIDLIQDSAISESKLHSNNEIQVHDELYIQWDICDSGLCILVADKPEVWEVFHSWGYGPDIGDTGCAGGFSA